MELRLLIVLQGALYSAKAASSERHDGGKP